MYLTKEMMHNKFVQVRIPKPSEIFGRSGFRPVNPSGFTGDVSLSVHQSKIDSILEMDEMYKDQLARIAREREESSSK